MKIGLMYVSDYGFAAAPSNWTTELYNYESAISLNWIYTGLWEWTLVRGTDSNENVFLLYGSGNIGAALPADDFSVRPVFYLQSWILYSGGDGTQENPYRISSSENLISFTIDGTSYYAEEGMTWGDLVNSIYNILNIKCNDSSCFYANLDAYGNNVIRFDDVDVISSDFILEEDYTIRHVYNGGGGN